MRARTHTDILSLVQVEKVVYRDEMKQHARDEAECECEHAKRNFELAFQAKQTGVFCYFFCVALEGQRECAARACESVKHVSMKYASAPKS
jgi:hypothetical protein